MGKSSFIYIVYKKIFIFRKQHIIIASNYFL